MYSLQRKTYKLGGLIMCTNCKCQNKAVFSRLEQLLDQLWYELPQFEIENLKMEILEEIEK